MPLTITITTELPLTPTERGILQVLLGETPAAPAAEPSKPKARVEKKNGAPVIVANDPEPEEEAAVEAAAEAVEPEPELPAEAEVSLETAVARAMEKLSSGKQAEVKAALVTVGAKKVSDLKPEAIPAFLAALDSGS
jgi:hypothetical protein